MLNKILLLAALLLISPLSSLSLAQNNNFPVLNEEDWRSYDFDDIPWSEPVIVKDDFDGDQLAVVDRNTTGSMFWFSRESGIVSMWAQRQIRVYYYLREEESLLGDKWTIQEAESLNVKIGDEVFRLTGSNGNFPVEDDLANALANAPEEKAKIKITFEESGEDVVNDIGVETVRAWSVVYGD